MQEFSLEKVSESIHYGKTKIYFKEVLSSYHNGNYRSATVMLWSVAVCDVVFKLQSLVDLYGDASAKEILDEVTAIQIANPNSPAWELQLIDDVNNKTNLIDSAEYENLRYLQKQRHLSAHPVLNKDRELHSPKKETVRALIRNTLEELLIKPPFYTQHILKELLQDLDESKEVLNDRNKAKKYVESRYFSRTTPAVELNLFRSLWKFVFKLENESCNKNRVINLYVLEVLASRNRAVLADEITGDLDYYSNISSSETPSSFAVYFLSQYPDIYPLLKEEARLKIIHCIENNRVGKIMGWFIKEDIRKHSRDIKEWIDSEEPPSFAPEELDTLLDISDTEEWEEEFCNIVAYYYGKSGSYDQADARFQVAIPKYIKLFNRASLTYLAEKIEGNSQCHDRGKARHDYVFIKTQLDNKFGDDFPYNEYEWFSRKIDLGED
ncbi:hypothetical protein MT391_20395 [Vibrio sp. 1-Bac 57]